MFHKRIAKRQVGVLIVLFAVLAVCVMAAFLRAAAIGDAAEFLVFALLVLALASLRLFPRV